MYKDINELIDVMKEDFGEDICPICDEEHDTNLTTKHILENLTDLIKEEKVMVNEVNGKIKFVGFPWASPDDVIYTKEWLKNPTFGLLN